VAAAFSAGVDANAVRGKATPYDVTIATTVTPDTSARHFPHRAMSFPPIAGGSGWTRVSGFLRGPRT
jgi:hypothetical protein